MANKEKDNYDESSLRVLKGLEPVRARPAMYTRTDSPTHIIQEVIDNAADEALGGYATLIHVTIGEDGSYSIEDNGRGIPVGLHPTEKKPVVTLAFTMLHAGGKFDKKDGGAYAFSGGLHGVGVAVTTALSRRVLVRVKRLGQLYEVEYSDNGRKIGTVKEIGQCGDEHGTHVTVWPDPQYFDSPKASITEIERLLKAKAVMLRGVKIALTHSGQTTVWEYPGGLGQYLSELTGGAESAVPMYLGEEYVKEEDVMDGGERSGDSPFSAGEGAAFAFAWYLEGRVTSESYVNLIPTPLGGTHDSGLKAGVFEAVKSFIDHHALLPKNVKLQQEDVTSKMAYVLAAKILDPGFQGQTKDRLNTRTAVRLVSSVVRNPFEAWLNANVEHGKVIAEIAIKQALSRQKSAQTVEKKKSSSVVVLPGKLTDCEATTDNELFLVEGDSAGGSAKMARNKDNQAVLPLRGKVLNTYEVEPGRLFTNNEIHDISVAFGVDPHTDEQSIAETLANARYTRFILMTDADVDGAHIRALLLTLFYKHMPNLLIDRRIYVAQPPLFRIDVAASGKSRKAQRHYALDEAEKQSILQRLAREGYKEDKIGIGRFKGLGEMSDEQLKETAMDPATRRVVPVIYDPSKKEKMAAMFDLLMSKDRAASRREWMALKGHTVRADI